MTDSANVFSAHHLPEVIEMGRIYIEAVQIGGPPIYTDSTSTPRTLINSGDWFAEIAFAEWPMPMNCRISFTTS